VARGDDNTESDVDFLVDFEASRSLVDVAGLILDLQAILGVPVDVVEASTLRPDDQDILQAAEVAAEIVRRGRANFESDPVAQYGAEAAVGRIGDAASKLPEEVRASMPDLPRKEITCGADGVGCRGGGAVVQCGSRQRPTMLVAGFSFAPTLRRRGP
jgi:predicted nucleotidyltransferase